MGRQHPDKGRLGSTSAQTYVLRMFMHTSATDHKNNYRISGRTQAGVVVFVAPAANRSESCCFSDLLKLFLQLAMPTRMMPLVVVTCCHDGDPRGEMTMMMTELMSLMMDCAMDY